MNINELENHINHIKTLMYRHSKHIKYAQLISRPKLSSNQYSLKTNAT